MHIHDLCSFNQHLSDALAGPAASSILLKESENQLFVASCDFRANFIHGPQGNGIKWFVLKHQIKM